MTDYRIERDSMGEVAVPGTAYYGAQAQRALENFPISGIRFPRRFIRALGLIKKAAADTNLKLGLLDGKVAGAIIEASQEVIDGKHDHDFVVDIFQTGSGTSTNMNANEIIANRAIEILGGEIGSRDPVHPNDNVNMGQSSNDVIPSAIHVAVLEGIENDLLPGLEKLKRSLAQKADEFGDVVKIGRTHLQDATPVRLGQEFSGYAAQIEQAHNRLERVSLDLSELALGGTAVGTGLNTHPDFAKRTIAAITAETGIGLREARNHFAAQAAPDAVVETSGSLKTLAVSMMKIANDIRWLASGPRCGIGEIDLPAVQPGSSIMPGKVNPVIAESVTMVCVQVIGNDAAVTVGGQAGNFELNVMLPVIAHNILQSIRLLDNAARNLAERCIDGIEANVKRCEELVDRSLAMVTSLVPIIGYDKAAEVAKEAYKSGRTVREVLKDDNFLSDAESDKALDPRSMTEPGRVG